MGVHLELRTARGLRLIALDADTVCLGSGRTNDVTIADDPLVSRLHCVFARYAGGWTVRDLDSRNGTYVLGKRVWVERPIWPGDEITVGSTSLVFRADEDENCPDPGPEILREPEPYLTRREREVLVALCRPLGHGEVFTGPASVQDVAADLHVSEAAVRQHLLRLARKFGVGGDGERRRTAIANEAIRRGIVHMGELRRPF